jgi:hypothetical protein
MGYKIEIEAPEVPYPGGTEQAEFIRRAALNIEQGYPIGGSNVTRTVIDLLLSVAKAMGEQAPRIPEPGLWGVVSAHYGSVAGRPWTFTRGECGWVCLDDGSCRVWDSLIDPVLIREGVES